MMHLQLFKVLFLPVAWIVFLEANRRAYKRVRNK